MNTQTIQTAIETNARENFMDRKALFAQLLAEENITVRHAAVRTASFDVKNRVVTLPIFQVLDNDIYDLMVGHETGHALFTPLQGMHDAIVDPKTRKPSGFRTYLNVVEDARIERLVKNKFPGLANAFARGYRELHKLDFFELKGVNIKNMLLIDRINLHYKLGHVVLVPFSFNERQILHKIDQAQTWDDVMAICEEVWGLDAAQREAMKQAQELAKQLAKEKAAAQAGADGDSDDAGENGDEEDEDGERQSSVMYADEDDEDALPNFDDFDDEASASGESQSTAGASEDQNGEEMADAETTGDSKASAPAGQREGDMSTDGSGSTAGANDPFSEETQASETDKAFSKNSGVLYSASGCTLENFKIPRINPREFKAIVQPQKIHDQLQLFWEDPNTNGMPGQWTYDRLVRHALVSFGEKHNAQINLMVNEFEMRRNASTYARAKIAKTGAINPKRLARYNLSSDIFKRVSQVPGGKNHGMVLVFDESGSMGGTIGNVLEQACILVAFGRRVGIPVEVYGFTDNSESSSLFGTVRETVKNDDGFVVLGKPGFVELQANCHAHLRKYITTDMSMNDYRRALGHLLLVAKAHKRARSWNVVADTDGVPYPTLPRWMALNGTPLHFAMAVMVSVLKDMIETHKVEIPSFFMLGDGDATDDISMPKKVVSSSRYGVSSDYATIGGYSYARENSINYISFEGSNEKVKVETSKFHSTSWAVDCAIAELMNRMGVRTFSYHVLANMRRHQKREVDERYGFYKTLHDGFFFIRTAMTELTKNKYLSLDKYPNSFTVSYLVPGDSLNATAASFEDNIAAAQAQGKKVVNDATDGKVDKRMRTRMANLFVKSAAGQKASKVFISKFVSGFAV